MDADLLDFFKEIEETEKAVGKEADARQPSGATALDNKTQRRGSSSLQGAESSIPAQNDADVDISKLLFGINPAGAEVAAMISQGVLIKPANVKPAAAAFAPRVLLAAKQKTSAPGGPAGSSSSSSLVSSSSSSSSSGWTVAVVAPQQATVQHRLPGDDTASVGMKRRRPEEDISLSSPPPPGHLPLHGRSAGANLVGDSGGSGVTNHVAAPADSGGNEAGAKGNVRFTGKGILRACAGEVWIDKTLADWPANDFRLFCGDLGNEVTDDILAAAFSHLPSFAKARVVRDQRTFKSRGYGFVSLLDAGDALRALREINGSYIGNRPVRLKKVEQEEKDYGYVKKAGKNGGGGGTT